MKSFVNDQHPEHSDPLLGLFQFQADAGRDHPVGDGRKGYPCSASDRRREIGLFPGACTGHGWRLPGDHAADRTHEGPGGKPEKERYQGSGSVFRYAPE